ncbi:Deoxyribodipyrimidine photolyase [Halorhabdus sp. SVX81]|nr:Deoxyribodipyrimidine photolyase [Halorhabdus sp. SVX81]
MSETAVVWLRRDLRTRDNATLAAACAADRVLPVYCFEPRRYGQRAFGGAASFEYDGIGAGRARFEREAVRDLRDRLRETGSDLFVRHGRPDAVLPAIVDRVDADRLHCQTLAIPEERTSEQQVRAALPEAVTVERHWTHTLHHVEDLPTPYDEMPDTFTPWRQQRSRSDRGTRGAAGSSGRATAGADPGTRRSRRRRRRPRRRPNAPRLRGRGDPGAASAGTVRLGDGLPPGVQADA